MVVLVHSVLSAVPEEVNVTTGCGTKLKVTSSVASSQFAPLVVNCTVHAVGKVTNWFIVP